MANKKINIMEKVQSSSEIKWSEPILKENVLNLIGISDMKPPKNLTDALNYATRGKNELLNQYARDYGHVNLVDVLSLIYTELTGLKMNSRECFTVCIGSTNAFFSVITSFVREGDEVIIIEPHPFHYAPIVEATGGIMKFISLKHVENSSCASSWILDQKELEKVFNDKTKLIVLNNPMYPIGKVFSKIELQMIADQCVKWNALCLSDESDEWLVYEQNTHKRIVTLPGMWERTITISSTQTLYNVTGWMVNWIYGHQNLMRNNIRHIFGLCISGCYTPLQEAFAIALQQDFLHRDINNNYIIKFNKDLKNKRDTMVNILKEIGLKPIIPEAGCFVAANWLEIKSKINLHNDNDKQSDCQFIEWLIKNVNIQGVPMSPIWKNTENYVCFSFNVMDETLIKVKELLNNTRTLNCQ